MPPWLQMVVYTLVLASLIFTLHYQGPRIGAGPFVVVVAGIVAYLEAQIDFYIIPFPGILLYLSSHILLPSILAALIVLYIVNGTIAARQLIYGIILVSLLIGMFMLVGHATFPDSSYRTGGGAVSLFSHFDLRSSAASLISFTADMIVIAIVYQGTINAFPKLPVWLVACIALLAALWTDAILFAMLSDLGYERFARNLPGAVLGKTVAALVLSPALALYMGRFAPRLPDYQGLFPRPVFDLFSNRSERISLELVRAKAALREREKQVIQEHEKAEELRDFIKEISHDLRTPLTAINLKAFQLSRTTDGNAQKDQLRDLSRLTNQMNEMIEDMLTLSRLENHEKRELEETQVNSIVRAACEMVRPQAEDKGIHLAFDLAPQDPSFKIDSDDLNRVVLNLVSNAVRYTPRDGQVTVRTILQADGLHLQIIDTGIGIDADDIPHIFERFFRTSDAKRTEPSGTGLGLAIVKKVIELYGGSISVDSHPQQGSTFSIFLPGANG